MQIRSATTYLIHSVEHKFSDPDPGKTYHKVKKYTIIRQLPFHYILQAGCVLEKYRAILEKKKDIRAP